MKMIKLALCVAAVLSLSACAPYDCATVIQDPAIVGVEGQPVRNTLRYSPIGAVVAGGKYVMRDEHEQIQYEHKNKGRWMCPK